MKQLAAFFWIGWEGAVRAKLEQSVKPPELFVCTSSPVCQRVDIFTLTRRSVLNSWRTRCFRES